MPERQEQEVQVREDEEEEEEEEGISEGDARGRAFTGEGVEASCIHAPLVRGILPSAVHLHRRLMVYRLY